MMFLPVSPVQITQQSVQSSFVTACEQEVCRTVSDVPEWRIAYGCERYNPGKQPYYSVPGRTEREKNAGSPVRAGRMDRDTYMKKGGTKDFAGL